jgi:hypothetical protein
MKSGMDKTVAKMEMIKSGVISKEDWEGSMAEQVEKNVLGRSPEDNLKKAQELRDDNNSKMKAINASHYDVEGDTLKPENLQKDLAEVQERMVQQAMLDKLIENMKAGKKTEVSDKVPGAGGGVGSGFASGGTGMGGQTTTLENAFMQNASASLAADDLAQKHLQAQLAGNAIFQEVAADIKRSADAQERAEHP